MSTSTASASRLFIGNLAPQVDEYTLVQVFSKYGKLAKLDLMYHKAGPQKGQPRGYAFVEFVNANDALTALAKLHDRVLRGRRLVVTNANSAPQEQGYSGKRVEVAKTALSLMKAKKVTSAEAQIAAMEAKLATMSQRVNRSPTPERIEANELEAEVLGMAAAAETAENSPPTPSVLSPRRSRSASPRRTPASGSATPRRDYDSPRFRSPRRSASPRHGLPASPRHGLPARPELPARPPAPTSPAPASSAFQRGLAGLPKKPTFTPK